MVRKTVTAFLIAIFLSIGAVAQLPAQDASAKAATFDERLGADDGAAFAILFGANMRGNIDVCDCNNPRGGIARRIGYVEGFKKKFKNTPVITVDAGFFFYNSTDYTPHSMLMNSQVARAYSRWPVDVINLGRFDIIYAQKLLAREGLAERTEQLPMIKNIISANGVFGEDVAAPAPYIIKEVTGPRITGKKRKLRIGFVGLAEPIHPGAGLGDAMVTDMFVAARRTVPKLRKECDLVVIVAHSEMAAAMQLANENPEADIIIAGNAEGLFKPRQVGSTLIVSAAPGNTQQGDLRVYMDKEGRFSFKFRSTDLDEAVPSDPAALAFADAARRERETARQH